MLSFSRVIFHLQRLDGFAELNPNKQAVPLDPTTIIFKGVYLDQSQITSNGLANAKRGLAPGPPHTAKTLLRPVSSSDGPPYWSAIVYRYASKLSVLVRREHPIHRTHYQEETEDALCYHADQPGGPYAWETDLSSGRAGYFLTGGIGLDALWQITRIQVDALDRQVLTFTPVRIAPTLVKPAFSQASPALRKFLTQHFEGFQQAIVRNAPFDAINRANNIAEGVLAYCLVLEGEPVPDSLAKRLSKARTILDDKKKSTHFSLTTYAYHLAHQIRILHQRLHENQSGKMVKPEVGLNLAVTVSELLVEVGLGSY